MDPRVLILVSGQAAVAAAVAATTWAAGAIVTGALRRDGVPIPWALTTALGFALVGQLLLLVAMAGLLQRAVVIAVTIGIHILAIPCWRRWCAAARGAAVPAVRAGALVLVIAAMPGFLLTLYPPLGFDQTMYHLPFARAFAASGTAPWLPALRFPIFPQLAELLNAAVLLLAGAVATQATGWVALGAGLGLAYAWARDLAGDAPSARAGGWLAVGIIAGSPMAVYLAATGYVEPLLALLVGASLYAADRARVSGDTRWLVAAGALAGSAASVKYLGLYFVPAAILVFVRRAPWRVVLRDLAIYGAAALVALLPTYGRIVAQTGNPLFPFYPELFGPSPWGDPSLMGARGAERWRLALTRLWDVTFRRHAVGGLPHFSPAFLLALPIVVLAAARHDRLRRLLLAASGYLLLATTHAHHLFAIAVLWAALAGAAAARLLPARSAVLTAAALVLAGGGEAYTLYRLSRLGPPPTTSESRDRFLAAQLPLYPAIAWLNRQGGAITYYAVAAERMVDYASGTQLGDVNGPASFARMEARVRTAGSVAAALESLGASHLLVPAHASFWHDAAARDPRLARVFEDARATIYRVGSRAE
jgi:hypothetical protein